ncbi:hypothetical protein OAP39_04220, partial [Flavobacteriaceae bacterium]|nr:hypothetical protein [Flavobacteriaceae bacterium]
MKKSLFENLIISAVCLFFICCEKENDMVDEFSCTVDYIELKENSKAVVKFDITLNGVLKSSFLSDEYVFEKEHYLIGDDVINILNFVQKGNEATFDFEYGSNCGPICKNLFENIPTHEHLTLIVEAEKSLSDKVVGKWKIKK